MIGTFPRGERWVTLQLAAGRDQQPVRLLELLGECPGDPGAQLTRITICGSAEDALAHAAARLRHGWAAHAMADEPGDAHDAAAALHAPAWTPTAAVADSALAPAKALAVVAHAAAATAAPFCLFPHPTAGRRA